jgi:integrating conjugative element protein (TIGR03758 family)
MQLFGGYDVAQVTGSNAPIPVGTGSNPTGSPTQPRRLNTNAPFPTGTAVSTSSAFASGSGVAMAAVNDLVLGGLSVAMFLWTAWVTRAQFSSWRNGKVMLMQMQANIVSSLILLSFVLFIALA